MMTLESIGEILEMSSSCNQQASETRTVRKSLRGILHNLKIVIPKQIFCMSIRVLSSGVKEVLLLPIGIL